MTIENHDLEDDADPAPVPRRLPILFIIAGALLLIVARIADYLQGPTP